MKKNSRFDHFPDWINQLRSQSWQIEILIAGSTVYTLFSLSDGLQGFFYRIYPGIDFNISRTLMLFGVYVVTRILLIGFLGNLVIRAIWLAYLGINFAFPLGVNFDRIKNNAESKKILKSQPTILARVTNLERLSKLSYSLSILLAIFMTSVFITVLLIHIFLEKIGFGTIIYESWFSYSMAILIAIVQLGVLDRLFLSRKSKYHIVNKVKKSVSIFLEYFTLSFLFRREFLAIKSNTNRWAFMTANVAILFSASLITSYQIGKYWPYGTISVNFFDDREYYSVDYAPQMSIYNYDTNVSEDKSVLRASIQSEIIKGRYLRLFVTSWSQFDKKLKHSFQKFEYPLEYESKDRADYYETKASADSIFNLVVNDIFEVEIDGVMQRNLSWKTSNHPKSKVRGYVTFIDIDALEEREHQLIVYVNYLNSKKEDVRRRWKDISFWKE